MKQIFIGGELFYHLRADEIKSKLSSLLSSRYRPVYVTLHYTVGRYNQPFNDYQINIDDNNIYISANFANKCHEHTWRRNTNNLGISFMAMLNKSFTINKQAIENCSLVIAILRKHFKLDISQIYDHSYWGDIDGYAGQPDLRSIKIDNVLLLDIIKNKSKWYLEKLH